MAVGQSFLRSQQILGRDEGFVAQQAAEGLDFFLGQSERLARVRLRVLLPSRQPSRRRIAGGELRLGTVSMYMGAIMHI